MLSVISSKSSQHSILFHSVLVYWCISVLPVEIPHGITPRLVLHILLFGKDNLGHQSFDEHG